MLPGVLQSEAGVPFILRSRGSFAVQKMRSNFLFIEATWEWQVRAVFSRYLCSLPSDTE